MAGRFRRFIKRNMNYPKGFGRKRRTPPRVRAAEYTRGEELKESQLDISNPVTLTDGLTQGELLYGVGDLNTDAGAGNSKLRAAITDLQCFVAFTTEEGVTDNISLVFYMWLMQCNNLVFTDWTLNGRMPYQGGLQQIPAAVPFRVLTPVVRRQLIANTDNEFMAQVNAKLWHKRRFTVPMPDQVYLMYHMQIVNDGSVSGIAASQLRYSSRYGAKVHRPNLA